MAVLRFLVGLAAVGCIAALVVVALSSTVIPRLMGWKTVAITSGSMEAQLNRGDVVIAEPYRGQQLEVGMVLVFHDPTRAGLISHRLYSINADGTLTTKGDANRDPDSTPIQPESVVGIGRVVVPGAGWPTLWVASADTFSLVAWVLAFLFACYCARWGLLTRFDPWAGLAVAETDAPLTPSPDTDGSEHCPDTIEDLLTLFDDLDLEWWEHHHPGELQAAREWLSDTVGRPL